MDEGSRQWSACAGRHHEDVPEQAGTHNHISNTRKARAKAPALLAVSCSSEVLTQLKPCVQSHRGDDLQPELL